MGELTDNERLRATAKRALHTIVGPSAFEEVEICHRLTKGSAKVMIDVGAHVGGSLSLFAADGWTVHAFEPDPRNRKQLIEKVGGLPGITINDTAISDVDGATVEFFGSDVSTGISTLVPFHDSHEVTATVTTTRLDTYVAEHGITEVGFLKIDTEGHDLTVLQSFPWDRLAPDVVLCEFEDRKTVPQGHTYRDLAEYLHDRDYVVIVSEWHPIVEYGQAHRWKRAVLHPVDLEPDAWGNLLAVRSEQAEAALQLFHSVRRRHHVRRRVDRVIRSMVDRQR